MALGLRRTRGDGNNAGQGGAGGSGNGGNGGIGGSGGFAGDSFGGTGEKEVTVVLGWAQMEVTEAIKMVTRESMD